MTELPTTFGKYFLTEKLATGGMAEIYLAKLVGPGGFEKQLVIKQIHPRLTGQRHFVDLFVTEAKTLVTLTHGNIVPVYELGVIDDTYFIAMEYIDGPTLYRLTESLAGKGARMDPPVAAWICARILEGLDYAHRKGEGVIHRDLSPRNVMLSRDGDVKLVDFGIAVSLGASDDATAESAPTGSFPYMSPEQVRREALTGQTDLFSVGVLLWEMLVGERLFARKDPDATLAAVTGEAIPRPSTKRPDIPAKLDEVVMRALERDQDARWPSAGEMLAQLNRYLYGLDQPPGPREVAALVARYCPPETRRLPTHADPLPPGQGTEVTPAPGGPRTAVIPRDATPAKGKQRARTETFATNVELKHMLERSTPMFGVEAIGEAPAANEPPDGAPPVVATKVTPREPAPAVNGTETVAAAAGADAEEESPRASQRAIPRASRSSGLGIPEDDDTADGRPLPVPGRTPPSQRVLVAAAIGTLLLGAVALVMFLRARGPSDAGAAIDAPLATIDDAAGGVPSGDAMPAGSGDATTLAALDDGGLGVATDAPVRTPRDAAPRAPVDAAPRAPLDATGVPRLDAAGSTQDARNPILRPDASPPLPPHDAGRPRIDAGARAGGMALLKIGADPWGEVIVDGIARGRTPLELALPAGRHTVEIIFKGEDPPRSSKKTVDLVGGETQTVTADFTQP